MKKFVLERTPFLQREPIHELTRISNDRTPAIPDVHLVAIQVCRATLAAGMAMSVLACITTTVNGPRIRLQCALAATACGVSSIFYRHLYDLRRLPDQSGYSEEGNSVSNAMRYTSWSVTIALLAWIALLLRGPFYDGFKPLGWSYEQWLYMGPLLASLNVLMGIPGWEAARVFSRSRSFLQCSALVALLVSSLFLLGGFAISILMNYALNLGYAPNARTASEQTLSKWVSRIWIAYPALQVVKTLAVLMQKDHVPQMSDLLTRVLPIQKTKTALQFAFRTMVAAPQNHARETHALYRMIEPEHALGGGIHLGTPAVTPWVTQLLDTLMAAVDMFSQGVLALILVTYALPVE